MAFELHPQLAKDCFIVKDLALCRLLLMNDRNYPWCILVPMRDNKKDIYELTDTDQQQLVKESSQLSRVMMELFQGKKMNVAALGNMVPQLHLHHIVRRESDACWPKPVWGQAPAITYNDVDVRQLIATLRQRM